MYSGAVSAMVDQPDRPATETWEITMMKSGKCFAALGASFVLALASVACAVSADTGSATVEKSAPSISPARDHRGASATAIRVASTHNQAGESAHACEALSQSLESYRKALVQETGDTEVAASSIHDDSDGMAEVRARFGCKR
jgi:hypothetical protein